MSSPPLVGAINTSEGRRGWQSTAFLLFGVCLLISALAVVLTMIDSMYMVEAAIYSDLDLEVALPQLLEQGVKLRQIVYVNILSWCSTNLAKLSYLFLIRKLIGRIPLLIRDWWFTALYYVGGLGGLLVLRLLPCYTRVLK